MILLIGPDGWISRMKSLLGTNTYGVDSTKKLRVAHSLDEMRGISEFIEVLQYRDIRGLSLDQEECIEYAAYHNRTRLEEAIERANRQTIHYVD